MQDVVITPSGKRAVEVRGYPFAPQRNLQFDVPFSSSIPLAGGLSYSYAQIYRSQPWVQVAVRKLMKSGAQLPLKLYTQSSDGNRKVVRPSSGSASGLCAQLLERPAPGLTPTRFKRYIIGSRAVYGNFLAVKMRPTTPVAARGADLPNELWPVPWWRVSVVEGVERDIDWFVVHMDNGDRFPFSPEEVVYSSTWSPDTVMGVSPLEPLRRTLAVEDAALRETAAVFENGARPDGVFTADTKLSPDQARAIRTQLHELYGGPDNAYKTAVLGAGLDWKPMSFSHKEAELVPIRQLAREEIVAAYDMPPPMVGILDRATFSNITEQHKMLYQDTLGPELTEIEEDLEAQLLRPEPQWESLDLEFDMNEVLKASINDRATAYAQLQRLGFPPNFFLHLENQPEVDAPEYQTGYVPRELIPLDPAVRAVTDPPTPEPVPAPAADPEAQAASERWEQLTLAIAGQKPTVNVNAEPNISLPPVEVTIPDPTPTPAPEVTVTVDTTPVARVVQKLEGQIESLARAVVPKPVVRKVIRDAESNIVEIREVPADEAEREAQ